MADVTISSLPIGTPSGTDVLPYSNGSTTSKVQVQSLPVAWSSVTSKPSIGIGGMQLFTSSGTFTVPEGVTKLEVHLVGGGGGASGFNDNGAGSGGDSFITGINIIAGGGRGGSIRTGGTFSGTAVIMGNNGNAASTRFGGAGLNIYGGAAYGRGGTGNAQGGGSGAYACGLLTVTSGQILTINPGAPGYGHNAEYGQTGAVLVKW